MWVAMLTIAKDVYRLPLSFMPDCFETEFLKEALSGRLGSTSMYKFCPALGLQESAVTPSL